MTQRFYSSASSTNRTMLMELPTLGHRRNDMNIFKTQEEELQKSLSRQSSELSRGKQSSKNLHSQRKQQASKHGRSVEKINQVVEQYIGEAGKQVEPINNDNFTLSKFQFKLLPYGAEVALAYAVNIGLMYLIQLTSFPFFLLLFVMGLMASVMPWSKTNIIMGVVGAVVVANFYLRIQILTYPAILVFYFSVLIFNQHNKIKLLFIPVLVTTIVWGFVVIPALYAEFVRIGNSQGFYYVFPIFVYILRVFLYLSYREIKYSEYIFMQLPFFLTGLEYGVMLTLTVDQIEFWYLMVFFTLQIINDRTQFSLRVLSSIVRAFGTVAQSKEKTKDKRKQSTGNESQQRLEESKEPDKEERKEEISILAAHASGYCSINFVHLVCIVYVYTYLPISSSPYTSATTLSVYIEGKVYLPLVVWGLGLVYELMCLVLERKRRDKLLIGFTNNGILHTAQRGLMLAVGLWMFYLGLGVANYAIFSK